MYLPRLLPRLGLLLFLLILASPSAAQDPVAEAEQALSEYRSDLDRESSVSLSERLEAVEPQLVSTEHDSLRSKVLEIAGLLRFRRGDLDLARELWARGLEAARASGSSSQVMALLNMNAVGMSQSGDLEEGIALFHELAEMRHEKGDIGGEGIAWSNIGNANMRLLRLPEGMEAAQRAQECFEQVGFDRGLGNVYILRGNVLLEMNRSEEALAAFDAGVEKARQLGQKDLIATALVNRGRTHMLRGEPIEFCLADVDSAVTLWEGMDNRHQLLMCRMIRGEVLAERGYYDLALRDLEYVEAERQAAGEDFELLPVWNMIGACYVELGRLEEGEAKLRQTLARLQLLQSETEDEQARIGLYRRGGLAHRDLARCLILQGRRTDAWAVAETGRAAVLREQLGTASGGSAAIELGLLQERLREAGASYVHVAENFGGHAFAFVIDPEGLEIVDLELYPEFYADLEMAVYLMSTGSPDELCAPPLRRMGAAVAAPIAQALGDSNSTVLVSLSGAMSGMPMDALLIGEGDTTRAAGDEYALALVPSATTWAQLEDRPAIEGEVVAFADPTLDVPADTDASLSRFRAVMGVPLPQARLEAERVTQGGGLRLEGASASKAEFFRLGDENLAVLHFATHAVVDPVHPEQSALLLAGGEDERLTAGEIESQPLRADLVTLSGCRTGGGLNYLGEGTLGLARSFLVAGARSVVMSRWDVEDGAARRFMELLYQSLEEGSSRAEAMRAARRGLGEEGFPHRDRSAFVLAGVATEPVLALVHAEEPGHPTTRFLLLIAVAVLLLGSLLVQALRRRTGA